MKTLEFSVSRAEHGQTLQTFLSNRTGLSKSRTKALLDRRNTLVNGRRVWMARHLMQRGDTVTVAVLAQPADATLRILTKDAQWLIVEKPSGTVSIGRGSIEQQLQRQLQDPVWRAAHRLDKDTSGCLLFARGDDAFAMTVEAFRQHRVSKLYHAIVCGRLNIQEQTIRKNLAAQRAVSHLRVLDASTKATHIQIKIDTGRTHQIRKHLAGIGHPLIGDGCYGPPAPPHGGDLTVSPRTMLHAAALHVQLSPERSIQARSRLPADFRQMLKTFRLV